MLCCDNITLKAQPILKKPPAHLIIASTKSCEIMDRASLVQDDTFSQGFRDINPYEVKPNGAH